MPHGWMKCLGQCLFVASGPMLLLTPASMTDPGFGKGGFMRMCIVAATPPFNATKVAAAVLTASNCRETVSRFANYTSSKGVSIMEAVHGNPSGFA